MATISKEDILNVLNRVTEPVTGQSVVSLRMIEQLSVTDSTIQFTLITQTPQYSEKDNLVSSCHTQLLLEFPDIEDIDIRFEYRPKPNGTQMNAFPGIQNIIAVASGKGGVGKSTISTNLAVALSQLGHKVGIIDADIYGPSLPTMFGLQGERPRIVEIDGKMKILPLERNGIKVFSIGFVADERQAVVWRGPMVTSTLSQFFSDTYWGELDFLILDLPPGTGDIHITLSQTVPITGTILVTTPQKVSYIDARKAAAMFRLPTVQIPIIGIVENMAWFTPAELPNNKYYIFGEGGAKALADEFEVPILAQIPLMQEVAKTSDLGVPIAFENSIIADYYIELAKQTLKSLSLTIPA